MSRKARKRRARKAAKKPWLLRVVVTLLVLAVIGMGGGYLWLKSWLHSEEFRQMLSAEASKSLNAEAEFGEFRWDGTMVSTRSFSASGVEVVDQLDARGISMDIGLDQLMDQVVLLQEARINELSVHLDLRESTTDEIPDEPGDDQPGKKKSSHWYDRWVPNDVQLTGMEIGQSAVHLLLDSGEVVFSGTGWSAEPGQAPGSYKCVGTGGSVEFPWEFLPELRLTEARLRYQDSTVFLTDSRFRVYERGYLTLVGEASAGGDGGYAFTGELSDVMAAEVLTEDWKQRLTGRIEGDFAVTEVESGPSVSGHVKLLDGVLTGLPVLESLGAYGGNPRFLRLTLSDASTNFMYEDGSVLITDFQLGSEGLMHMEGMIRIEEDDSIDGRFRIGLTPGTLARIPGAETQVFLPGERGLLWAPVHVTGTIDDPKEDLTDRLILAAGMRMFEIVPETGEQVLRYTRRAMSEDVTSRLSGENGVLEQGESLIKGGRGLLDGEGDLLEEAEDVIRQGTDVYNEVENLFDIIRGKDKPKPPTPQPQPQPPSPDAGRLPE